MTHQRDSTNACVVWSWKNTGLSGGAEEVCNPSSQQTTASSKPAWVACLLNVLGSLARPCHKTETLLFDLSYSKSLEVSLEPQQNSPSFQPREPERALELPS